MPSQGLINDVPGIQMDPNAGPAMRFADAALPMLLSGGRSTLDRMAEAPGFIPKVVEAGGHVLGAGTDLGLQTLGGMAGNYLIGGPEGQFGGSLIGGSLRPGGATVACADPSSRGRPKRTGATDRQPYL